MFYQQPLHLCIEPTMNINNIIRRKPFFSTLLVWISITLVLSSCITLQQPPTQLPSLTPPPPLIWQTTFYVDGIKGSDLNSGTQAQPWQTIQKAADIVSAGNTVIVESGNYPERVRVVRSGVSESPITFQAEGRVVMEGFTVKADHVTIKDFEITNTPDNETDGVGIFVQGSYCDLENNYIHYATRGGITLFDETGIPIQTSNCTVRNNRLYRNAHHGIEVSGETHLIEGNEIWGTIQYHPNWINPPPSADADGIRFFGSGHIFRGNFIHDISLNDPYNLDPHIDAFQTWGNPDGTDVTNNIIFEKNIISLQEGAVGWQIEGAIHDLIIRNNKVEAHDAGIRGYAGTGSPHNLFIANNIFIGRLSVSPVGITITNAINVTFNNNIILDQTFKTLDISGEGNDVAYNLAYNRDGSIPPAPNALPLINSLWGIDPLFTDSWIMDYHLQTASPAINAGVPLTYVNEDFDGIVRPQGAGYDIGPFEYSE